MLNPVTNQTRDHAWIAAHIPHAGAMCLLDRVVAWDAERVVCCATSHRSASNPLRQHGRLGAACGIEYAAQAMAVHGALAATCAAEAGRIARPGMLVSVRHVELAVGRLDDLAEDLAIEVRRLSGSEHSLLYAFTVTAADRLLLSGRATVLLAQTPMPTASAQS